MKPGLQFLLYRFYNSTLPFLIINSNINKKVEVGTNYVTVLAGQQKLHFVRLLLGKTTFEAGIVVLETTKG